MLGKLWWEAWPGRLEYELQALRSANIEYVRDENAFKNGRLKLRLKFPHCGTIDLIAEFPPFYPYFRPEVFAAPGTFQRHQNPLAGNLCLLGRRTENWDQNWTLADLLVNQFPALVKSADRGNLLSRQLLEEAMGEPVTAYYCYEPNSIILVDTRLSIAAEHVFGTLTLIITNEPPHLRGELVEVRAAIGKPLFSAKPRFGRGKKVEGRWLRMATPIPADPRQLEKQLLEGRKIPLSPGGFKVNSWFVDPVGILLTEELQQNQFGEAWMFLVRLRQDKTTFRPLLVRSGRAGAADFSSRIPTLAFLRKRRVALIGLGSIGSAVAIELARAGIAQLSLVDCDFVEPGTIVRWSLGMSSAGLQKTLALQTFIRANYPLTSVDTVDHRFGSDIFGTADLLYEALERSDIIVDTTAEFGIHQLLADYAMKVAKPFVYSYLTAGGYGGLVARMDPQKNMGCWRCLQIALYEEKTIPEPPVQPNGELQPPGCGERTATFAGFDAAEVSLETTRMVISSLADGSQDQCPKTEWDVGIVSFRSSSLQRNPPSWETFLLSQNAKCACSKK